MIEVLKSFWLQVPWWSIKKIYKILLISLIGVLIVGLAFFFLYMRSLPALSSWHTVILKNEYTTHSPVKNYKEYIALENRLFDELEKKIYNTLPKKEQSRINRYTKTSISNPQRWDPNYNRTFELSAADPKGAVLLLHGMSDAPYSLHNQAAYLHRHGYWVLGLRMPGHGTIPSGLCNLKWQDMAAVVKFGMTHLKEQVGDKPIFMMGYSTGASLALNYTLEALLEERSHLIIPDGLVFYSPAIGVSAAAPLAVWQSRIGWLLSLPKLEWNTIAPEYDPFKYGSFAVNAGDQVYRLTQEVQKKFKTLHKHAPKHPFPPVLSFSSIVDSTVSVSAVVNDLFANLPKGKHTLVLFDINHHFDRNHLIKMSLSQSMQTLRRTTPQDHYTFELISNINTGSQNVERIVNHKTAGLLPYAWPKGLYSLSHLSLPISPDDPLYGSENAPKSPGIQLGHLAVYGETGVLQSSPASLLRQRWNPFHDYVKERVLTFFEDRQ